MQVLALLSVLFFLSSSCASLGGGVDVFKAADLGKDGFPKSSKNKRPKGVKSTITDQDQYVIKPGDKLSIKFFFNPELNEEDLIVRPDGRVSLQLIHEIKAEDLTATQLTSLLAERYKGQLKNPEIAVIVRSVKEHPSVYVDGQVRSPGVIEIIGTLNVLQAVALAKGFKEDTAKVDEIIVTRLDQGGHPFVIKLDLMAAIRGKDLSQNIQLLPDDFIHVPKSFW